MNCGEVTLKGVTFFIYRIQKILDFTPPTGTKKKAPFGAFFVNQIYRAFSDFSNQNAVMKVAANKLPKKRYEIASIVMLFRIFVLGKSSKKK